jgi:hypothetical protein
MLNFLDKRYQIANIIGRLNPLLASPDLNFLCSRGYLFIALAHLSLAYFFQGSK